MAGLGPIIVIGVDASSRDGEPRLVAVFSLFFAQFGRRFLVPPQVQIPDDGF
jgi:hypothetical protein